MEIFHLQNKVEKAVIEARSLLVQAIEQFTLNCSMGPLVYSPDTYESYRLGGRSVRLSDKFIMDAMTKIKQGISDPLIKERALPDFSAAALQKAGWIVDVIWSTAWLVLPKLRERVPCSVDKDLALSVLVWWDMCHDRVWDKKLKHSINHLFVLYENSQRSLDDVLTESPEPFKSIHKDGFLLSGSTGRLIMSLLGRKPERTSSRAARWAFLQGLKKGLPHLEADRVQQAAEKHAAALSQGRTSPDSILRSIKRTVREVMRGAKKGLSLDQPSEFFCFSHNSCAENQRSKDGVNGHGFVQVQLDHRRDFMPSSLFDDCEEFSKEVQSECWNEVSSIFAAGSADMILMGYEPHLGCRTLYGPAVMACETLISMRESRLNFDLEFTEEGVPYRWSRAPFERLDDTYVKFILEPLKIRTITKSPFNENALYTCLQKQMWKALRCWDIFELIGEPVQASHIERLQEKSKEFSMYVGSRRENWKWAYWQTRTDVHPEIQEKRHSRRNAWVYRPERYEVFDPARWTFWVSGDYSAATDGLHSDATEACIQGLTKDEEIRSILRNSLLGRTVNYEGCFKDLAEEELPAPFLMKNGQLMGCVFSFPILCLLNLAVFRHSMETYLKQVIPLRKLAVRCNGDDILFCSNEQHYKIWEDSIGLVGFTKSVGKNYISPSLAMINSCYFEFHHQHGIRKLPFPNMGMVFGQKKGSSDDDDPRTFNDRMCKLVGQFKDLDLLKSDRELLRATEEQILNHRNDIASSHLPLEVMGFLEHRTTSSVSWAFYEKIRADLSQGAAEDSVWGTDESTLWNHLASNPLLGRFRFPNIRREWASFCKERKPIKMTSHDYWVHWIRSSLKKRLVEVLPRSAFASRLRMSCGRPSLVLLSSCILGEASCY